MNSVLRAGLLGDGMNSVLQRRATWGRNEFRSTAQVCLVYGMNSVLQRKQNPRLHRFGIMVRTGVNES